MKSLGVYMEITITYNSSETYSGKIYFDYPPTDEQAMKTVQEFNRIYGNEEGGIINMSVKVGQFDGEIQHYFYED